MAKRLKEDEIKTVYRLEATEAQQELHRLNKANRELTRVMDARRKEMVKLEAQGKKNTTEYKNLEKAIREDSKTLRENTNLIRQHEQAMGVNSLTMNQLRQRAKALRGELNNISKELQPDRWNEVNKKLSETTTRMNDLRTNASQLNKNLGSMVFSKNTFASFWGNLYAQLAMKISGAIRKTREFIAESTLLASQAQGIDHAFKRIANKDYLESLRKQTKGLVSDFTLMQSAVRAENFGIPLTQLGKMLEFAQNRARDTGENVDYLVESIVNGIGRKSPLILDNLGISTVRLQEEVKKAGDFATAVGNIIDEEMAKAGPAIDTAADAAQRKKVAWENLQLATGKFFVNFKKGWDDFQASFAGGLANMLSGKENLVQAYDKQIEKVAELDSTLPDLIDKYEKLKGKTKEGTEEHTELIKVMNKLAAAVPGVATEFDRYGNALAINTKKVWAFIEAEKTKLKYMHRDAIQEVEKEIEKTEEEITSLQEKINKGSYSELVGAFGQVQTIEVKYTDVEMSDMKKLLAEKEGTLTDHNEKLKFLNGTSLEEQIAIQREGIEKRKEFNQMNLQQLQEWIEDEKNAHNEYLAIAKDIYDARKEVEDSLADDTTQNNKTRVDEDKEAYAAAYAELESYLAREKALIQQKYIEGKINKEQYNREIMYLEQEGLRKTLELAGISFEKQMEIEFKLLEKKKEILEKIREEEKKFREDMLKLQKRAGDKQISGNFSVLQAIAKQNEEEYKKEKLKQIERFKKNYELSKDFGEEMGAFLGGFITDNSDMMKDARKNIIMMSLDLLETQVQMAVAQAAGWSFAQPDSVLTLGAAGAVRAILMAGLIKAAFSAVKSVIRSKYGVDSKQASDTTTTSTGQYVVTGRESGGFLDVTREQDKRKYIARFEPARRGFIDRPTVIVGEGPTGKSREWVASNDALQNPTIIPFIKMLDDAQQAGNIRTIDLNHLMRARMAGFEPGGFIDRGAAKAPDLPVTAPFPTTRSSEENELLKDLRDLLSSLKNDGIPASVVLTELQRKQDLLSKSRKIGTRS